MKSKIIKIYYLLFIAALPFSTQSCEGHAGSNTPRFNNGAQPFVVEEIKNKSEQGLFIEYWGLSNGDMMDCFIAPTGMFNIGDTVVLCKP